MPVPAVDPTISIKDLVKSSWVPGNIVGTITPDFHTGWWNPKSFAVQLTFSGKNEAFEGAHGYNAIQGAGGGPVQIVNGVLFMNCWAYRDEGAGGPNPKTIVYDMAKEVNRIVLANFDQITNLDPIGILAINDVPPDMKRKPLLFRKSITGSFKWRTT